jgi:hypothetical protein
MPYKPEAKRRFNARYYRQKVKTSEIPCTQHIERVLRSYSFVCK